MSEGAVGAGLVRWKYRPHGSRKLLVCGHVGGRHVRTFAG
jgi:hypothetical protein